MNPWEQIKQHLATKISTEGYQNWLAKTEYSQADASTIWVQVPNEAAKEWIEEEYGAWVHSALTELKLPYRNVSYDVAHALENKKSLDLNPQNGGNDFQFGNPVNLLNPKFTFNSFVVGTCNQFAHAAAKQRDWPAKHNAVTPV